MHRGGRRRTVTDAGGTRRATWLGVVLVLLLVLGSAGTVVASDAVAIFQYEPSTVEADQGETVTVAVTLWADETPHGGGNDLVTMTASYDADHLILEDVDPGTWMEQGDEETDVETDVEVNETDGRVTVEQARSPAAGGADGYAPFANLTFRVAEDAPDGEYDLTYGSLDVRLTNGHYQPTFEHDGTIVVGDAAGDEQTNGTETGDAESGAGDGAQSEASQRVDDPEDGSPAPADDAGPGFGPVLAVLAALGVAGVGLGLRSARS